MLPLTGYGDRLSVRPGETIEFKVSSTGSEAYQASLVRIICADPNPDGPGWREVAVESGLAGSYPSRVQEVRLGSWGRVADAPPLPTDGGVTLIATIWPTLPGGGAQGILDAGSIALAIGADGGATATLALANGGAARVAVGEVLAERCWYRVWATYDPAAGRLGVGQAPLDPFHGASAGTATAASVGTPSQATETVIAIGALGGTPAHDHFNGKIELPQILTGARATHEIEDAALGRAVDGIWARWDFAREIASTTIVDTGPRGLNGVLINMPARAMVGSNWSGREMCWRHAPDEYGAIHFHDDDIGDCGWQTAFAFTVPADLPSGAYAVRLRCGVYEDAIPFFVCPPKGRARADLCVVIPTFTYVIYGNHARRDFGETWRQRARDWGAYPFSPSEHTEYGASTYNVHNDGSGICHASRLRPLLTLRPGHLSVPDTRGSGLRHFQADTHLLDWLEAQGYAYDILTDEELHAEGAAALAPYRAVLTTTHPEYHTAPSLDAFQGYRDGGGRLGYLGGNGFYWRIAIHPENPGILEIRRGEGGIRTWAAEPGEYYHAFDGAYGGLWRRNGRPPQRLVGVGFTAQGVFESGYYRRRPGADDPRAAWILDGVDGPIIGDFGLSGGGAAGFELDRADVKLGTPEHAIVLASSENVGTSFVLVPEEQLTHRATWSGEPADELIRADIVFFETPAGGAVFSVGSITFCGSLAHNARDNAVSRMLGNVLDRFLDPDAEFIYPG